MVTYNENDIAGYKAALARYAAKENSLADKWKKRLDDLESCVRAVPADYPSVAVRAELERLSKLQSVYSEFLSDLKTPADMFLADFEMRSCR